MCTYWCKAMNCEQATKKTKKFIPNKIDTKEAQEAEEVEEEEASKQEEGKQAGRRTSGSGQGKSFAFHLARRLTVQRT